MSCSPYSFRMRSYAAHGRRFPPTAWLLLLACSGADPDAADVNAADGLTTVPVTRGELIATFGGFGRLSLDNVRGIALAKDGNSVHVLDTHHVHHLDLNGRRLASMGGPGMGPGELEAPTAIHATAGGGAWVYDPTSGRATRYGPDALVEAEISGIDQRDAPFIPFGDGILMSAVRKPRVPVEGAAASDGPRLAIHTEELNPDRLLSYYRVSGGVLDVASPPGVPDAFARDGRRGRVIGWRMAAISPNEIAVVIGGSDLGAWRLMLPDGGARIESLEKLPVPADVRRTVRESAELGRGVFAMPIASARVVGNSLWVVSTDRDYRWNEPLAFSIPLDGDTISYRLARRGFGSDPVDVIVLPDRLIVAYSTEVRFLALARD
ncbi:MAG: hypothetical protein OXI76_08630 [Gemmatimonadota bacterium]|nr:hypothetical protein [Gemmatimonadota bacterium]